MKLKYFKKDRDGLEMGGIPHTFIWTVSAYNLWSIGQRKGIMLHSMNFLWSYVWKEGRTLFSLNTSRLCRYRKFYKEQSQNKLKRYIFSPN
tara:strand:- start:840 stop:1112 length:273 start_codon:yes stop_codon:yes gene_type:complete